MSIRKILVCIFISVFLISCEEGFNPYGEYVEKYAFTCILKSDENSQAATLFRSYRPDGFDPYTYTTDPSVKGADIRVWYNDSVFVFRDTSVTREDTTRYKTPFSFYYNDQFTVANGKTIELEVLLPNGRRLRSSSITPGQIVFDNNSEVVIPPVGKNIVQIIWNNLDEGTYFFPRLAVRYKQTINGEIVEKVKEMPVQYINQGNDIVPVFHGYSAASTIVYNLDAITKALGEISEGDPDKQNYSVYQRLSFELKAFDLPASRYISSTGGSIDDLTVSVDVSDYTNIEGGFGLFASYSKKNYTRLRFLQNYIESFGYNFID
jgi:hypothetical protein